MKKILVPTDFSPTAKDAFKYACQLAATYDAVELTVLHAYTPEIEADYPNIVPPVAELLEARKALLATFLKNCPAPPQNTTVTSDIVVGFAVEEIVAVSEDADLVVMGTTGESGILEKVFGSISNSTARKANCPVILVPQGHQFSGIDHILYASNYASSDDDMVEKIIDFNKPFNATIHFVHVREEDDDQFEKTKEEIFEELFENETLAFPFQIEEIEAESVSKGLTDYAKSHPVDLVVMVNKHRSWWARWFNPSITRAMAFATHTPLMVLHWED